MERVLTWGGKHAIQYIDDVLQNCTPENYIFLLTNVTPVKSITEKVNVMLWELYLKKKNKKSILKSLRSTV